MPIRMPIGEFARACRLTVKALRHYDEIGLLEPAHVDRKTGYRYYVRTQARDALVIGLLRELDVPLSTIREVLRADPARVAKLLEAERARRLDALRQAQAALASLEHVIHFGLRPPEVEVRSLPALRVARIIGATDGYRHVDDTAALVRALLDSLRESGIAHAPEVMAILPDGLTDDAFRVEVCVPIEREGPVREGITFDTLPAIEAAVVRHIGPYATLGVAHHAAYAFLAEHGHAQAGAIREVYVSDPEDTPPSELITEVILPLA